MIRKSLLSFFLLSVSLHAVPVYIGTNSNGSGKSQGIYYADFNAATGNLTVPVLAVGYQNQGFLALHPTKHILYGVGKPFADQPDGIAAFEIVDKDHSLKLLGERPTGGKGACHLAVDATGRTVAVANYDDGRISTVRLDDKGIPSEVVTLITNAGFGPNKERQEGPHAHGVYFDRANRSLFVPDLGLDQIFIYPFDAATSKLGQPLPSLKLHPGAGPRHMAVSPDGRNAYVINELENSITTTVLANNAFTTLGTVTTLPVGFTGKSFTAELEVHPNGKFVYGSNRGHDSIVVYKRDGKTGALTFLQHAPCGGKAPRHFKIDPSGTWLLCAHQETNTISVLPLDPKTGMLGAPTGTLAAPNPICLLFVP
jgi:6-phosphogluconolactonase